jgi:predicted component of type VI protein secretion system
VLPKSRGRSDALEFRVEGPHVCERVVRLGIDDIVGRELVMRQRFDQIGNGVDGSVLPKRQGRSNAVEFRVEGPHVCERVVGLGVDDIVER